MTPRYLRALMIVSCLILLGGSGRAGTLYRYDFENGVMSSWTPTDGMWSLCQTVTTGTQEYCQTDATAQLSSASFDGDSTWADYSVQAEAINRRQSVEGVNLDEELVRLTTYQQAYTASARMIQAAKDLFDVLSNLLN